MSKPGIPSKDTELSDQLTFAASNSEYTVKGLVQGQQYWLRVCAVRGEERGPWSDPATRIANA